MAIIIQYIPVLTGEEAKRFERLAAKNAKKAAKSKKIYQVSVETLEIMKNIRF